MLAALYVATGNELPEEYAMGGRRVNEYIFNNVEMREKMKDTFGLIADQQCNLANAGDAAMPPDREALGMPWDEPAIINALLAEVDRLEAVE